jgi:hypothetical protein
LKELNSHYLSSLVQVFLIKSLTEFNDHSRLLQICLIPYLYLRELMSHLLIQKKYGIFNQEKLNKEMFYLKVIFLVWLTKIVYSHSIVFWFPQNVEVKSHTLLQLEAITFIKKYFNFKSMELKLNIL